VTQVPYWTPTHIRHHLTNFRRLGSLAPWICATLLYC